MRSLYVWIKQLNIYKSDKALSKSLVGGFSSCIFVQFENCEILLSAIQNKHFTQQVLVK